MTYSVTLLASLLASAHGFATMRTGGVKCFLPAPVLTI